MQKRKRLKYTKVISIRLTQFQVAKLRKLCFELQVTRTELIRRLITPTIRPVMPWGQKGRDQDAAGSVSERVDALKREKETNGELEE